MLWIWFKVFIIGAAVRNLIYLHL